MFPFKSEIKFRAIAKDTGAWVYGSYVYLPGSDTHHIISGGSYDPTSGSFVAEQVEVDPDTIGQFTSCRDIHGKDVYEGDILLIYEDTDNPDLTLVGVYGIVIIRTDEQWLINTIPYAFTVVGNEYDNPDLAKQIYLN